MGTTRTSTSRDAEAILRNSDASLSLLPYQQDAILADARFTWNCWARQTGKSFTFSMRRVIRGLARRRNQIILSAGERQSREVMEKVRQHCRALKVWSVLRDCGYFRGTSFRQLEVHLPGGIRIIGLPANPMTARGFTGDVFLDEFAMHRDDDEIWAALFPTLLRGEGELDVASTPRGQKNMFYRLRANDRFSQTTMPLDDAVSRGLDVDAASMRDAIGDDLTWRQEFCCEFVDESTSFMTHALIRSCQDERLSDSVNWDLFEQPGVDICAGVDIGRYRDVTAIWLWGRQGDTLITHGVVVMEAATFTEQESVLCRILDHRSIRRVCMDATGMGLHLTERLAERYGEHRVEKVIFTSTIKSEMAGALRMMAERGLLRIPVDDRIANDWHSLSRMVTSGGHVRFDADRSSGGHADLFWAAALGIQATGSVVKRDMGLVTTGRLTFARQGAW